MDLRQVEGTLTQAHQFDDLPSDEEEMEIEMVKEVRKLRVQFNKGDDSDEDDSREEEENEEFEMARAPVRPQSSTFKISGLKPETFMSLLQGGKIGGRLILYAYKTVADGIHFELYDHQQLDEDSRLVSVFQLEELYFTSLDLFELMEMKLGRIFVGAMRTRIRFILWRANTNLLDQKFDKFRELIGSYQNPGGYTRCYKRNSDLIPIAAMADTLARFDNFIATSKDVRFTDEGLSKSKEMARLRRKKNIELREVTKLEAQEKNLARENQNIAISSDEEMEIESKSRSSPTQFSKRKISNGDSDGEEAEGILAMDRPQSSTFKISGLKPEAFRSQIQGGKIGGRVVLYAYNTEAGGIHFELYDHQQLDKNSILVSVFQFKKQLYFTSLDLFKVMETNLDRVFSGARRTPIKSQLFKSTSLNLLDEQFGSMKEVLLTYKNPGGYGIANKTNKRDSYLIEILEMVEIMHKFNKFVATTNSALFKGEESEEVRKNSLTKSKKLQKKEIQTHSGSAEKISTQFFQEATSTTDEEMETESKSRNLSIHYNGGDNDDNEGSSEEESSEEESSDDDEVSATRGKSGALFNKIMHRIVDKKAVVVDDCQLYVDCADGNTGHSKAKPSAIGILVVDRTQSAKRSYNDPRVMSVITRVKTTQLIAGLPRDGDAYQALIAPDGTLPEDQAIHVIIRNGSACTPGKGWGIGFGKAEFTQACDGNYSGFIVYGSSTSSDLNTVSTICRGVKTMLVVEYTGIDEVEVAVYNGMEVVDSIQPFIPLLQDITYHIGNTQDHAGKLALLGVEFVLLELMKNISGFGVGHSIAIGAHLRREGRVMKSESYKHNQQRAMKHKEITLENIYKKKFGPGESGQQEIEAYVQNLMAGASVRPKPAFKISGLKPETLMSQIQGGKIGGRVVLYAYNTEEGGIHFELYDHQQLDKDSRLVSVFQFKRELYFTSLDLFKLMEMKLGISFAVEHRSAIRENLFNAESPSLVDERFSKLKAAMATYENPGGYGIASRTNKQSSYLIQVSEMELSLIKFQRFISKTNCKVFTDEGLKFVRDRNLKNSKDYGVAHRVDATIKRREYRARQKK